jgi:hypothetical protein
MALTSIISTLVTNTVDPGNGSYASTLTITNTGTIHPAVGFNILAIGILAEGNGEVTTIFNAGTVEASGTGTGQPSGIGIELAAGYVGNTAIGALISGGALGVVFSGSPGTVLNTGTITGSLFSGVELEAGGDVTNSGSAALIFGGDVSVRIDGSPGAVLNEGTIATSGFSGVWLTAGGDVINSGSAALISGVDDGVEISGSSGTVLNDGRITASSGSGVNLQAGGDVTNSAGDLISGFEGGLYIAGSLGTVLNDGTIAGSNGIGVYLKAGGNVTNSAGDLISGFEGGLNIAGSVGAVLNNGTIKTNDGSGVFIGSPGTVLNTGTITGSLFCGVEFDAGGDVTNSGSAALIFGGDESVRINGSPGTVLNEGTIGTGFSGVLLTAGGDVINSGSAALISGTDDGVEIAGSSGTVLNDGRITASSASSGRGVILQAGGVVTNNTGALIFGANYGVYFKSGGVVTNSSGALISGEDGGVDIKGSLGAVLNYGSIIGIVDNGVLISGSLGTVLNDASITAHSDGVYLKAGGVVTNSSGALISGSKAVVITSGTLVNAGTITGSTDAVDFTGNANRLVADAGAVFHGAIIGAGAGSTLELASGTSLIGTLSGVGETVTGFQTIDFDAGAAFTLTGNTTGLGGGTIINGFTLGDTIILEGFVADQADAHYVSGIGLELTQTGGDTVTLDIAEPAGVSTGNFIITDPPDETTIAFTACFAAGTRIRTPEGEISIEALRIGDLVTTPAGGAPILWLGHRTIDCARHPDPQAVWPILIRQGAFADGVPARDLFVSPGHSIYVDGLLMQAEKLVNGATILQVPVPRVTYWHVELARHGIIFAEGLPAETYLDTGNRVAFINGGAHIEAHPDLKPKHWAETCVPLVFDGPEMCAAKTALLARAAELGHSITDDDDVHIIADGQNIDPIRLAETRAAFLLPAGGGSITLVSRTFIPAQINPHSRDERMLGTQVKRLQLDGKDVRLNDDDAFGPGWYHHEPRENSPGARWTTGMTPIPSATRLVVIDFAGLGYYWARQDGIGVSARKWAEALPG